MMQTLIEEAECEQLRPCRTRVEAAQLLEELRAAYLELASPERGQIRNHISKLARIQSTIESL